MECVCLWLCDCLLTPSLILLASVAFRRRSTIAASSESSFSILGALITLVRHRTRVAWSVLPPAALSSAPRLVALIAAVADDVALRLRWWRRRPDFSAGSRYPNQNRNGMLHESDDESETTPSSVATQQRPRRQLLSSPGSSEPRTESFSDDPMAIESPSPSLSSASSSSSTPHYRRDARAPFDPRREHGNHDDETDDDDDDKYLLALNGGRRQVVEPASSSALSPLVSSFSGLFRAAAPLPKSAAHSSSPSSSASSVWPTQTHANGGLVSSLHLRSPQPQPQRHSTAAPSPFASTPSAAPVTPRGAHRS